MLTAFWYEPLLKSALRSPKREVRTSCRGLLWRQFMSIEFVWNWLRSRTVACYGTSNVDHSRFSIIESLIYSPFLTSYMRIKSLHCKYKTV